MKIKAPTTLRATKQTDRREEGRTVKDILVHVAATEGGTKAKISMVVKKPSKTCPGCATSPRASKKHTLVQYDYVIKYNKVFNCIVLLHK